MDSFNNKLSLNEKSVCKDQKFKLKLGYRDIKNIPDQPMPPIVKDLSYFRATCRDSMTNQQKIARTGEILIFSKSVHNYN